MTPFNCHNFFQDNIPGSGEGPLFRIGNFTVWRGSGVGHVLSADGLRLMPHSVCGRDCSQCAAMGRYMVFDDEKVAKSGPRGYAGVRAAGFGETEQMVDEMLKKLENDVARLARATEVHNRDNRSPVKAEVRTPLVHETTSVDDEVQSLPRLLTKHHINEAEAPPDQNEDLEEYKGAAFRGFCLGLLLIVPIVVWTTFSLISVPVDYPSGILADGKRSLTASAGFDAAGRLSSAGTPVLTKRPTTVANPAAMLGLARQQIDRGDIGAARRLLSEGDAANSPAVVMALAETYDPNMLAAWNALLVEPDIEKAKQLYARAAVAGIADAERRLSALR